MIDHGPPDWYRRRQKKLRKRLKRDRRRAKAVERRLRLLLDHPERVAEQSTISWALIVSRDPCCWCMELPRRARRVGRKGRSREHIVPASHGGTLAWTNIVGACATCNKRRGNTPVLHYLVMQLSCQGRSDFDGKNWEASDD